MMKSKISLYRFLLHYGTSVILLVMFMGLIYMLHVIEIKNKVTVEVFYKNDNYDVAYISRNTSFSPSVGEVIEIDFLQYKKLLFRVQKVTEEVSYVLLELTSIVDREILVKAFAGNTKVCGYIYTNPIKLWDLIFRHKFLAKI